MLKIVCVCVCGGGGSNCADVYHGTFPPKLKSNLNSSDIFICIEFTKISSSLKHFVSVLFTQSIPKSRRVTKGNFIVYRCGYGCQKEVVALNSYRSH